MPASSAGSAARTEASRSASGMNGAATAVSYRRCPACARPEHPGHDGLARRTTGPPGRAVLDARWRPDGTGRDVHAAGHIPGAVSVDWRADLVDMDQTGDAILLARVTGPRGGDSPLAPGSATATTVVVYDDTQGLYAARVWWSLRAYGLEHVRILDGGFPAWAAEGRTVDAAPVDLPPGPLTPFVPRGPNRFHLTTSEVRGLLGAPGVTLLDARAPAEYRGYEGTPAASGTSRARSTCRSASMHTAGSQRLREATICAIGCMPRTSVAGARMVCYDGSGSRPRSSRSS